VRNRAGNFSVGRLMEFLTALGQDVKSTGRSGRQWGRRGGGDGVRFVARMDRSESTRHAQLFRLREDYAYKYSIAASVDSFMKQAKEYADDIAAACYYELTYNPAEHMDSKNEDARMINPIFEKMLWRLEAPISLKFIKH
jgi:hypothetical protein